MILFFDAIYKEIIKILPIPVIIGIAFIVFCAWLINTLSNHEKYGETLRSKYFLISLIIAIIGVLCFYFFQYISGNKPEFEENEIGLLISNFEGDESNQVQKIIYELLELSRIEQKKYQTLKVKKINKLVVSSQKEALEMLKLKRAKGIIWGTKVNNDVSYVKMSRLGHDDPYIFPEISLPNVKCIEKLCEILMKYENSAIINPYETKIKYLENTIDSLKNTIVVKSNPQSFQNFIAFKRMFKNTYVLSIGNDNYPSLNLRFAGEDAKKIGNYFKERYNSNSTILINSTRADIDDAFQNIKNNITPSDALIVFFSGLSTKDEKKGGYILPIDYENNEDSKISANELNEMLNQINSKQTILFIDACYAESIGSFLKGNQFNGDVLIGGLFSSSEGEVSYEYHLGHNTFADFLMEGINGKADTDNNSGVTMNELLNFINQKIVDRQHPKLLGNFNKFLF